MGSALNHPGEGKATNEASPDRCDSGLTWITLLCRADGTSPIIESGLTRFVRSMERTEDVLGRGTSLTLWCYP